MLISVDHKALSRISVSELKHYVKLGRLSGLCPHLERSITVFNASDNKNGYNVIFLDYFAVFFRLGSSHHPQQTERSRAGGSDHQVRAGILS
jgi:hypothetical protein